MLGPLGLLLRPLAREVGMLFLVAGSWLYAEMSAILKRTIDKWGNLGKLTFYNVLPTPTWTVVVSAAFYWPAFYSR